MGVRGSSALSQRNISVLLDFLYEDAESTRGFRVAAFLAPLSLAAIFVSFFVYYYYYYYYYFFFYRLSFFSKIVSLMLSCGDDS